MLTALLVNGRQQKEEIHSRPNLGYQAQWMTHRLVHATRMGAREAQFVTQHETRNQVGKRAVVDEPANGCGSKNAIAMIAMVSSATVMTEAMRKSGRQDHQMILPLGMLKSPGVGAGRLPFTNMPTKLHHLANRKCQKRT